MPGVTTQESLEPLHSGMMSFANPRNKISSNDDETIENFDNIYGDSLTSIITPTFCFLIFLG